MNTKSTGALTARLTSSDIRKLDTLPGNTRSDRVRYAINAGDLLYRLSESVARISEKMERLEAGQNQIGEQIDARIAASFAQFENKIIAGLNAKMEKMSGEISVIHAYIEGVKAARKKADEKKAAEAAEREKQNQAKPATDANSLFHRILGN